MAQAMFFPFLLGVHADLLGGSKFSPEYTYTVNKTTVVYAEPLQTTTLNSTITCHPFIESSKIEILRCYLNDITFVSTLTYKDMNMIEEITRTQIKINQRFQMKFLNLATAHDKGKYLSLHITLVEGYPDKMIKSLIIHFMYQFDIDIHTLMFYGESYEPWSKTYPLAFSITERSPIGNCNTFYSIDTEYKKRKNITNNFYQLRSYLYSDDSLDNDLYLRIFKSRQYCYYSPEFSDFLSGMRVTKYEHKITVINDQLELFTVMEVGLGQLPEGYGSGNIMEGAPVIFTETVLVKPIYIKYERTEPWKNLPIPWNTLFKRDYSP